MASNNYKTDKEILDKIIGFLSDKSTFEYDPDYRWVVAVIKETIENESERDVDFGHIPEWL